MMLKHSTGFSQKKQLLIRFHSPLIYRQEMVGKRTKKTRHKIHLTSWKKTFSSSKFLKKCGVGKETGEIRE